MTGTCHHHYLQRALQLAERGRGRTSPNPVTGCVVVKDGRIIGEGFHERRGGRHAEAVALDACRESPRGAHLYCNLEPCVAYPGKLTPPCAGRIIHSGIGRVTVATLDPNPEVSGAGVRLLRAAGIQVTVGAQAEAALRLNLPFFTAMHYRRPFVHLKMAQSLDGRIATRSGNSRWITDAAARRVVHRMRAEHDAIVVGRGTALRDDPRLTVRGVEPDLLPPAMPWRVVLDGRLSLPAGARLVSDEHARRTMVLTTASANPARRQALAARGVQVHAVAAGAGGLLDVDEVLRALYGCGIRSLLVEGGRAVYTSFLRAGRYDRITAFVAPLLIGDGVDAVGDLGCERIADAVRLQDVTTTIVEDQVMVSGYRDLDALRRVVLPAAEQQTAAAQVG